MLNEVTGKYANLALKVVRSNLRARRLIQSSQAINQDRTFDVGLPCWI